MNKAELMISEGYSISTAGLHGCPIIHDEVMRVLEQIGSTVTGQKSESLLGECRKDSVHTCDLVLYISSE